MTVFIGQKRALLGGLIPPWVDPGALLAMQFGPDRYWRKRGGLLPATSVLTTTRSSGINLPNAAGVFQTLGDNTLPRTDRGLYANGQFVQSAVNWNAPANETISLGTGTFTLAVWGSGSIAVAAGTATGSGFGSASEGSPVTFALSGAGTVSLTVTGSPDYVSVTNTAFAPPAANPPGPVLASDIRAVQGVRPSNAQPEPFPGWEAAGLDDGYMITTAVNIDRLNSSVARTIAAIGANAQSKMHVYLDTDNRIKAQLLKLGPELRGNGAIGLTGTATAATYNTVTGEAVASRGIDTSNQSFVQWSGLTTNGSYIVDVENTGATGMVVRNGTHSASVVPVAAGQRQTVLATAAAGRITLCAESNNTTANFTVHSVREVVTHYTLQSGVISTLGDYDIAAILTPGANSLAVSGVSGDTNASAETLPAGATTLRVGSDFDALNPFNGWIKELQILKVAA